MADAIFRLDRIGVDYPTPAGTVTGLHDVSIDVPRTGITVFAGPSGSGKSTLLRVLGLFERPARGVLWFDGVDTGALRHSGGARCGGSTWGWCSRTRRRTCWTT